MIAAALIAGAGLAAVPYASAKSTTPLSKSDNPFRFAPKAKGDGIIDFAGKTECVPEKLRAAAAVTPSRELGASATLSYLNGPDGTTWYSVCNQVVDSIALPGGVAWDVKIKGFTYTIYDSHFKEVGTVTDEVVLDEAAGETGVAAIQLDANITQKFFNFDEKYEVMVYFAIQTSSYVNKIFTKAYSIGGTKDASGNDEEVFAINGYTVDAINGATDVWSEKFFITFLTEEMPNPSDYENYVDFLNACNLVVTTYKGASWGGGPTSVNVEKIPQQNLPGDQESAPFMFSKLVDGKINYIFSQYAKPYFVDPVGEDESATPDNSLVITVKMAASTSADKLTEVSTTSIPAIPDETGAWYYTYYGIGQLTYDGDADFEHYGATSESPYFIVTKSGYIPQNEDASGKYFYVYNTVGEQVLTLGENVDATYGVSDVAGQDRQMLFINTTADGVSTLNFTNLVTGEVEVMLPQTIDGEMITAYIDRVPRGDSYVYVSKLAYEGKDADGNTIARYMWINPDGTVDRIDNINVGNDIAAVMPYIVADGLSPYLFDTDAEMEYMMLVRRYKDDVNTTTVEELIVAGAENGIMLSLLPDETKGNLATIMLSNTTSNPTLCVVYKDGKSHYRQDAYSLPFTRFAGGDGSVESPYLIATIGDVQQIKSDLDANYKVICDIDADGYAYQPINDFAGTFDGGNFSISNLNLSAAVGGVGLFASATENAKIKDLSFVDPVVSLIYNNTSGGVLVGEAVSATISNIHVYGLKTIDSGFESSFGGIAGTLSLSSSVSGSSVIGADINLTNAQVGGVAGETRTTSTIKSSAFSGKINGGINVGGIVAVVNNAADKVEDCHVDAEIIAKNQVGGVVGSNARGLINRCYVEGTIEATSHDRWDWYTAVGGVVGVLNADYAGTADAKVVTNNIVGVTEFIYSDTEPQPTTKLWDHQYDTSHRIVGYTIINERPDESGKEFPVDAGLANNYVISSLAVVDSSLGEGLDNTEGKTQDPNDIDEAFYAGLGFAFGTTDDAPWVAQPFNDPSLYFEKVALAMPTEITVIKGEEFSMTVNLYSRKAVTLDDVYGYGFTSKFDETIIEQNYKDAIDGELLTIGFKALEEGTTDIEMTILGAPVKVKVTVLPESAGVDDVVVDNANAPVEWYNLQGVRVDGNNLASGIYIKVQGNKTTKVLVK